MTQGHSAGGRSILEMLEEQLDVQYAKYMEMDESFDADGLVQAADRLTPDAAAASLAEAEQKGKVAGLAFAIAKIRNPYKPSMDDVRQAMVERYEASA
jgi:hypothetical protein